MIFKAMSLKKFVITSNEQKKRNTEAVSLSRFMKTTKFFFSNKIKSRNYIKFYFILNRLNLFYL